MFVYNYNFVCANKVVIANLIGSSNRTDLASGTDFLQTNGSSCPDPTSIRSTPSSRITSSSSPEHETEKSGNTISKTFLAEIFVSKFLY